MNGSNEDADLKAAKAKKKAGQELTPPDEVRIAVDETNAAASDAVERGLAQTTRTPSPAAGKSLG